MARAGYSGYLYFSTTKIDRLRSGTGTTGVDKDIQHLMDNEGVGTAAGLNDIADAIDVTPSSDRETVETTTRQLARAGSKGEIEIYNSGSIEFTVSSELITSNTDPVYKLIKAGLDGDDVTLLDLSDKITTVGAWGQCGLYRLSRSPAAPKQLRV